MNEVLADVAALTVNARLPAAGAALLAPGASRSAGARRRQARRPAREHADPQSDRLQPHLRRYARRLAGLRSRGKIFLGRPSSSAATFATGGHGDVEHFFPPAKFAKHSAPRKTMETCCTHNMMRLTRSLYARDPRGEIHRLLRTRAVQRHSRLAGSRERHEHLLPVHAAGLRRLYHTPFDSFWCCTGSGIENHARYGETIYAHNGDDTCT